MEVLYRPELLEPRTNPPRSSSLQVPIASVTGEPTALTLNPGFNVVDSDLMNAVLEHSAIGKILKPWVEDGVIVLKGKPQDAATEPSLTDYNLTEATRKIEDCRSIQLLTEWQAIDPRKGVQKAIADQLRKLQPDVEPA